MPIDMEQLLTNARVVTDAVDKGSTPQEEDVADELTAPCLSEASAHSDADADGVIPTDEVAAAAAPVPSTSLPRSALSVLPQPASVSGPTRVVELKRRLLSDAPSSSSKDDSADEQLSAFRDPGQPFDPGEVPLQQLVLANAPAPRREPTQPVRHASQSKVTDHKRAKNKEYERERKKRRKEGQKGKHKEPSLVVDTKLSALWLNCVVITLAYFNFVQDVQTTKSKYAGGKGDRLQLIPRFFLPVIADLIAAGFTLVRWLGQ